MAVRVCIQGPGGGGVCIQEGLGRPPQSDTMGYGQRASGTHLTGLHSCFLHKNIAVTVAKITTAVFSVSKSKGPRPSYSLLYPSDKNDFQSGFLD